ncbi:taurine dioxygenase [Acuticoccus sediminis]|uniref:Taurine dioxygenase n=1 Tax=Acuticoccus sediminis TaxID=2184697 RepID=A0A8B2NZS9_9HYPH|nr:TauD/TfdA family dioxygenase [Acuticoccus sediminis]RAI02070.1 taurine dioxygenase [Acuticoccus sediminis]
MTINVRPSGGPLGAEIEGVDLRALDAATFEAVEAALHDHLVIVVRDQTLEPADLVAFARRFGRPEPHVIDQYHHAADPNILILSNRTNEQGEHIGLADGGTYFHTDYSYLATPARCTILYAIEIPDAEAGTTFADQRAAYEALPEEERERLAPLIARHHYGNRDDLDRASRTVASVLSDDQEARMAWERHPLVRRHPHTGKPALYAVSGSSFGIEGMDEAEGLDLLRRLASHSTGPAFTFQPQYRVGDVIVWDNASLLHCAPLMRSEDPRTLWRVTVKDASPTLPA